MQHFLDRKGRCSHLSKTKDPYVIGQWSECGALSIFHQQLSYPRCALWRCCSRWQMWARIQDRRCSSVPVFHLSWEESGASGGDGEVWARPQWVLIWFLIFITTMDGWRSSKQSRYLLGSAISGGEEEDKNFHVWRMRSNALFVWPKDDIFLVN